MCLDDALDEEDGGEDLLLGGVDDLTEVEGGESVVLWAGGRGPDATAGDDRKGQ